MAAVIVMRMSAVVHDTDQVRPVHRVGLPPLAPLRPTGVQLGVRLSAQSDVLPQVVTLPVQLRLVLEVLDGADVVPGDPRAVAWVCAGDGGGALWPGGGEVKISAGVTPDQSKVIRLTPPDCVLLHVMVPLAGVRDVIVNSDKVVVPGKVVVRPICVGIVNGVVTVGDDALKVRGVDGEFTGPVATGVVARP